MFLVIRILYSVCSNKVVLYRQGTRAEFLFWVHGNYAAGFQQRALYMHGEIHKTFHNNYQVTQSLTINSLTLCSSCVILGKKTALQSFSEL